ncbi:MAG: hypothetical protein FWC19_01375 [Treponema sp.]|nr:hypothetical protein [Treponema sp.]MCL2271443.1 hypothetical protein [Treponema sp.]
MHRSFGLFNILFVFFTCIPLFAQNQNPEMTPGLRRQALNLNIESRVLGGDRTAVWNEINNKTAIPGSPVGIQMRGPNIVLAVQFTPFIRRDGNVLVAHSQIWIADADNTVTYYTSIQTIPMKYDEKIHYYPLGSPEQVTPSIEIVITVNPNDAETGRASRRTANNTGNDR